MRHGLVHLFIAILAGAVPIHLSVAQSLPTTAPATVPANAMSREILDRIDRSELSQLYHPEQSGAYFEIHKLLEKYFGAASAAQRKELTQWISAMGLDANIVGRLVRIHMDWPELTVGAHFIDVHVGPHHVQYYFGVPPKYDRCVRWPMVIQLPLFKPFFTDPKPDSLAVAKLYTGWINDELAKHPDALVLMPMLDTEEGFSPSYAAMNSVIGAMNHALSQANIDPERVYLIGQDGAAGSVWTLGLHFTTYFAAINPFAGSIPADWQRLRFENLLNTAVVTWNDLDNKEDPIASTQDVVQILKRFKCDVTFLKTQHSGAVPPQETIQQAYEAVRAHARLLYPAKIDVASNRPDTMFNRLDWVQMYQATRAGHEQHLLFHHGGYMLVDANSMSVRASIADNKIEATTDNVESMRFYLNDQMIDFSKPVILSINSHEKFHKVVKPNLDEMLKDQLFLGRGWRYFTAVLDVDFGDPATRPTPPPH